MSKPILQLFEFDNEEQESIKIKEPKLKGRTTFAKGTYYLPGGLELGTDTIVIERTEIFSLSSIGVEWNSIEQFFQISEDDLKRHFAKDYNRGKAHYEIQLMRKIHDGTVKGTADLLKWMSKQKLGYSEKTELVTNDKVPDEKEVNSKLNALLKKHINKGE